MSERFTWKFAFATGLGSLLFALAVIMAYPEPDHIVIVYAVKALGYGGIGLMALAAIYLLITDLRKQ